MELAEDQHGPLDAFRSPPRRRLERSEDLVETGTEVFEDVVPVKAHAVPSMNRSRRASDENGARHELLQVPLGCQ